MDQKTQNVLNKDQLFHINKLIDRVGARQLSDFGQISTEIKADGTLITSCDRWSDEIIVNGIAEVTDNKEGVLSEEGSKKVPQSKAFWVVDPVSYTHLRAHET